MWWKTVFMATIIKKGIDFICQLFGMEKKEKNKYVG